jgi:large subunit ribosomal protein L7/L12
MNIGWIFLICALILLAFMAFRPWRRQEQGFSLGKQNFPVNQNASARLAEFDARLTRRDEVLRLLRSRQKIKAIKVYREDTGASLADAKAAVEQMELTDGLGLAPATHMGDPDTQAGEPKRVEDMDALVGEVEALVISGKKIQAIKLYRERTGLGLREAKEAIDLLESSLLLHGPSSLNTAGLNTEGSMPVAEPPGEDVRGLLLAGKKIQAIKLYREQTGASLKDAKAAIDLLEQALRYGLEQA